MVYTQSMRTTILRLLALSMVLLFSSALWGAPTVGVLPFMTEGETLKTRYGIDEAAVALALTETTIADLSGLSALTLVERSRLKEIIDEQTLALSGLVEETAAVEAGSSWGRPTWLPAAWSPRAP